MEQARLVADDGREVATIELATSPWLRARGLLGRSGLAPGQGMWLAPCSAIHTVGMRFAIDIVFLDRTSRVAKVCHTVAPYRMAWGGWRAHGALEFAAGEAARLGLTPGQRLRFQPRDGRA